MGRIDLVLATDIGMDPDDFIALNICLSNPLVDLRAVLVDPGTPDQVGLVTAILRYHGRLDIPIGVPGRTAADRETVDGWSYVTDDHLAALAALDLVVAHPARTAPSVAVLDSALSNWPSLTLVAIGPLGSVREWLDGGHGIIGRACVMGGYMHPSHGSGEYNFDADIEGATSLIDTARVARKVIVPANVTRTFRSTRALYERTLTAGQASAGHRMIGRMLDVDDSLVENQLLHDPLTVCTAIDEDILPLVEVHAFRGPDGWNAARAAGTGTFSSPGDSGGVNRARFEELFLMHARE
ncbi:MAG: nucleoside hydrolase [Candidatus Lokiarchaeota archaeon]|nr:nucleoside hydrolase [Candidatus Lokiarchaeota archaeon]